MIALFIAAAAIAAAPVQQTYDATVIRVIDGDTVLVDVPAWAQTPFERESVRIWGIDTPESRKPPAKCVLEVQRGKAASAYAKTLAAPGAAVRVGFVSIDKYGDRIDATLTLPDGSDWAQIIIAAGLGAPYDGKKKQSWCRK